MQMPTPEVRTEVSDGTARLVLDRPRAINALSPEMMHTISSAIDSWLADEAVQAIEIHGEGERGFCAGADVRAIRRLVLDDPRAAVAFFREEYGVNERIATSPKPTTAHLHGISMGGGLGLALHCQHVVAADNLQLAMPEVGIGLFPDVGITWQLAQAPGQTGIWLAMTGTTIDLATARYMGLLQGSSTTIPEPVEGTWIDECFAGDDAAEILGRLENHADQRARDCAAVIRTKSPWSVCVALEAVRRAERMAGVSEVLAQDLVLATRYVEDSDFVEGVRAQLVDKDRNPRWRHDRVEDVPRELVLEMFTQKS